MNFSDLTMKGIRLDNIVYLTDENGKLIDYWGRPTGHLIDAICFSDHRIEPGTFIPEDVPFIFRVTYKEEPEEGWYKKYGGNPIQMVTRKYIDPILTFERIK